MEQVVAITVTYNRSETLERCLSALLKQSRKLDNIIIVDNNSNLDEKKKIIELTEKLNIVHVLWLDENLGGAGGFEAGMAECLRSYQADWYWIMDDDAYPREDCLEKLLNAKRNLPEVGYLAPLIFGIDLNEYQFYHHKRLSRIIYKNRPVGKTYEELKGLTEIDANAFVGPLISSEAIKSVGIADGSLFIYGDDTEYTFRVSKKMKSYLVRDAVIDHQDPPVSNNYLDPAAWWKDYYCYRNQYFMIRKFHNNKLMKVVAYAILTFKIMIFALLAFFKLRRGKLLLLRVGLYLKAVQDGLCNRRGKQIDPVAYRQKLNELRSKVVVKN
jgi:GT2 family glycosyltransferase